MARPTVEKQDLGELTQVIREARNVGPSGVEPIFPDDEASFSEASEAFRAVLDEHFSESIQRLSEEDERVIIERLVVQSDDVPYIEYTIVDERESDE